MPAGDHDHEHRAPRAGPVERARHRDEGPGRRGVRRRLSHGQQPRGGGALRRRLPLSAGRLPQHRARSREPLRGCRLRGEVGGARGDPRDDRDPRGTGQPRCHHVHAGARRHLHRAERPLCEPRPAAEPRHARRDRVRVDRADPRMRQAERHPGRDPLHGDRLREGDGGARLLLRHHRERCAPARDGGQGGRRRHARGRGRNTVGGFRTREAAGRVLPGLPARPPRSRHRRDRE